MRIAATTAQAVMASGAAPTLPGPAQGASATTHEISCQVSFPETDKNQVFDAQKKISGFLHRLNSSVTGVVVQPLSSAPTGTKPLETFDLPSDEATIRLYFVIPSQPVQRFGRNHAVIKFHLSSPLKISSIKARASSPFMRWIKTNNIWFEGAPLGEKMRTPIGFMIGINPRTTNRFAACGELGERAALGFDRNTPDKERLLQLIPYDYAMGNEMCHCVKIMGPTDETQQRSVLSKLLNLDPQTVDETKYPSSAPARVLPMRPTKSFPPTVIAAAVKEQNAYIKRTSVVKITNVDIDTPFIAVTHGNETTIRQLIINHVDTDTQRRVFRAINSALNRRGAFYLEYNDDLQSSAEEFRDGFRQWFNDHVPESMQDTLYVADTAALAIGDDFDSNVSSASAQRLLSSFEYTENPQIDSRPGPSASGANATVTPAVSKDSRGQLHQHRVPPLRRAGRAWASTPQPSQPRYSPFSGPTPSEEYGTQSPSQSQASALSDDSAALRALVDKAKEEHEAQKAATDKILEKLQTDMKSIVDFVATQHAINADLNTKFDTVTRQMTSVQALLAAIAKTNPDIDQAVIDDATQMIRSPPRKKPQSQNTASAMAEDGDL